jgi:hypothetical protein
MGSNLRWDQRITYCGPLDVKLVVQIRFTRLGGIVLHRAPCPIVYYISVPSHPHPVSEVLNEFPNPLPSWRRRWKPIALPVGNLPSY